MKKEKPDIETFAAGIADKEDNPTIHELAKAFPEKTYKELEKYRDSDRQEEANQVPLTAFDRSTKKFSGTHRSWTDSFD